MLKPDIIPSQEPDLRVGIILPEDDQKSLELETPDSLEYKLVDDREQVVAQSSGEVLGIQLEQDEILVTHKEDEFSLKSCALIPQKEEYDISKKSGVKVSKVISGRSFHWKKYIEVFLPGKIEIQIVDNSLMLVNELPLEQYLMCVATSEMGADCPSALIESQTIAARSWMLANVEQKHRDLGLDVCNDDCCQRYQGTTYLSAQSKKGALNTFGEVLMYEGEICDARYSKNCGGIMETFENVWDGGPLPYMQPKLDAEEDQNFPSYPLDSEQKVEEWIKTTPETFCSPKVISSNELQKYLGSVDEEGSYFRWKFEHSQEEFKKLLNKKLNLNADSIIGIEPLERGYSGRLIKLNIEYLENGVQKSTIVKDQYEIRRCFHESFLYSSAFIIETPGESEVPEKFILKGAGWGHGAGYCQIGAVGMAVKGYSTTDILYHYFPNTELKQIYNQ